jgi:hypothetical protein
MACITEHSIAVSGIRSTGICKLQTNRNYVRSPNTTRKWLRSLKAWERALIICESTCTRRIITSG